MQRGPQKNNPQYDKESLSSSIGPEKDKYNKSSLKDAQFYNFFEARKPENTVIGLVDSVLHLMQQSVAGGVFGIHEAYMICGVWMALILTITLSLLMTFCRWMLVNSAQRMYGRIREPQLTYPELMEAALKISPWPLLQRSAWMCRLFFDLMLAFYMFASCTVMMTQIARNIKSLIDVSTVIYDKELIGGYIFALIIPAAIFLLTASVNFLVMMTVVADFYVVVVALYTFFYGMKRITTGQIVQELVFCNGVLQAFEFIGICMYSLNCITVALPVENNMKQPKKFYVVNIACSVITTSCMIAVGFFGSFTFGKHNFTPITIQFPFKPYTMTVKVFICIVLMVHYTKTFFTGCNHVWFYLRKLHIFETHFFWERFYKTICFFMTFSAVGFPDELAIMELLGTICITPLVFIYPAFIETMVYRQYPGFGKYHWILVKNMFISTIGMIFFMCGTVLIFIRVTRDMK